MSGFKPEYLEGIYNRIDDLDRAMRLQAMLSILNIATSWGEEEKALEILEIFESITFDRSKFDADDLRTAIGKMKISLPKGQSEATRNLMRLLLDHLMPRK